MEIDELKETLSKKDKEIDDLKNSIQLKENELNKEVSKLNNLVDSKGLLEDQLKTIKDLMKLKEDQIRTFETSLKLKEEKIDALEKTLILKEQQIKSSAEAEELQKEIDLLNKELTKADEDIERLEIEIETLKKEQSNSSDSAIIDFSNSVISTKEIFDKMKEMLEKAVHTVTISVPYIVDLQDLYLYEVRSSVSMKITCQINQDIQEHAELIDEYESFDNISIRNFESADRYIIIRDGEELLIAVKGNNETNHLTFYTTDSAHIRFFSSLVMSAWLRSRPI